LRAKTNQKRMVVETEVDRDLREIEEARAKAAELLKRA
jgi:hypothetical protein